MAKKNEVSDTTSVALKGARVVTYFVYAYALVAAAFLAIGSFLLLFGANASTPFVKFVYEGAQNFLAPFRGIWPPKPVGEAGYFSASAIFALIMYLILALGVHALIAYLSAKLVQHEAELQKNIEE